jgi:RNA polymerase sigma-70 factor (ECF subfamily)
MSRPREDWAAVLERVQNDDALALLKVSRLLNSFLDRWNAYDFSGDWDDLIQETVVSSGIALQEGRLRDRGAAFGYLKSTLRNKFVDRLKLQIKHRGEGTIPWEDAAERLEDEDSAQDELGRELRDALEQLPERQRESVRTVYLQGCTYDEAAERTGIPLGSLKRALREGLAALREVLADPFEPP